MGIINKVKEKNQKKTEEEIVKKFEYTYKNNLPIPDKNDIYLEMFKQHLSNDVQVIGLIGDYGTGKSSIIENFITSYENGGFQSKGEKNENKPKVILIKIPKFGKVTQKLDDDNNQVTINTSGEVRKYLTHQLLSSVSELKINSKELDAIKKKIYAHGSKSVTGGELVQIILFILFMILMFTDFGKELLEVEKKQFLVSSIFWITSGAFFSFMGHKLLNILKLQNYSLISSKQLKLERDKKDSYLDYDLDTLTTIINLIEENIDDLVIVVEDIDRYNNLNILTEISQIIKNTPNVKYILPVKHDLFESQIEIPKFFDATINVLPINDNLFLYDCIEKTLQENKVEVDVMLIALTTPFIKDIRIFNTIFNKYISLILNYKSLQPDLTKEQLNQIYAVSVLTILYPDIVRYQSDTKNVFYDYIYKVADINNIKESILRDTYLKFNIEKKALTDLINKLESKEKEYKLEIEESPEKIQELINEIIMNNVGSVYTNINWNGKRVHTREIPNELENGYIPTLEDLEAVKPYTKVDLSWLLELGEKNRNRENELITLRNEIEKKQEEFNLVKTGYEVKIKEITNMQFSQLAKIVSAEYFTCQEYDNLRLEGNLKFANDKDAVSELLIELVKNEYLTQSWYRYLSVIDKDTAIAQRRKFKYQIINEGNRYQFNEEEALVVTQELINTFNVENYAERKFLNKYVVKYLFENVETEDNSDKLLTIINTEREGNQYSYNNELVIKENKACTINENDFWKTSSSIMQLFEFALESKKVVKLGDECISISGYGMIIDHIVELAKIYYKSEVIPPIGVVQIFAASITDFLRNLDKKLETPLESLKVPIAFVEHCYIEIGKELFGEFFSELTMYNYKGLKPQLYGVLSNLSRLYQPLMENNYARVDHSPQRYIIGTQLFEYNENNLDYIIEELNMQDEILYKNELRKYLLVNTNPKYKLLVQQIILKKNPSQIEEIGSFIKLAKDYEVKFIDISRKFELFQEKIISASMFEPNETNYRVLLDQNRLEEIGNEYMLNEEYITEEDYNKIFWWFNEIREFEVLKRFAFKAREVSVVEKSTSALLLEALIIEKKVLISKFNFDMIKSINMDMVVHYISQFEYEDFEVLDDENLVEFKVFDSIAKGNYTLENKLDFYEKHQNILKRSINLEYPIALNIKILINYKPDKFSEYNSRLSHDDKIKLRQGLFKENIETFYHYYKDNVTYEELSNTKIQGYICKALPKIELLEYLLTQNITENQLDVLIEQYGFKGDIKFASTGRGSKTKNIPDYLVNEIEVLDLMRDKKLIKEYTDSKLINFKAK